MLARVSFHRGSHVGIREQRLSYVRFSRELEPVHAYAGSMHRADGGAPRPTSHDQPDGDSRDDDRDRDYDPCGHPVNVRSGLSGVKLGSAPLSCWASLAKGATLAAEASTALGTEKRVSQEDKRLELITSSTAVRRKTPWRGQASPGGLDSLFPDYQSSPNPPAENPVSARLELK